MISRRQSKPIQVGNLTIGGNAPIAIQSMTNTQTLDIKATVAQVNALQAVGADLVRISLPTLEDAIAFGKIKQQTTIPLVVDIHFDYKIALEAVKQGADCIRINPGNIGHADKVRELVHAASDYGIPIRIGVNAGSLEKSILARYPTPNAEALVESAMNHINLLTQLNFDTFKVSLKASDVLTTLEAYRMIAPLIEQPLHLGITEAGSLLTGTIKSSIAFGVLLLEGIGDTIRLSLSADPIEEIKGGWKILQAIGHRFRGVELISCPGCTRQNFDVIALSNALESRFESITTPIKVAVIGCVVNGPGEARQAQIGLTGGTPNHLLYINGKPNGKITHHDNLADSIEEAVHQYLAEQDSIIARTDD